jgi:hypothetical protein
MSAFFVSGLVALQRKSHLLVDRFKGLFLILIPRVCLHESMKATHIWRFRFDLLGEQISAYF